MKSLYYTIIDTSPFKTMLVLDLQGVLYYASLGSSQLHLQKTLVTDFRRVKEYQLKPLSTIKTDKTEISDTVEKFKQLVANPKEDKQIPVEIIFGTLLQKKVWQHLRRIKPGETRTYKDMADTLGTHSRVIGNCCGANRIAVIIPCHRVLGSSGQVTGYRYGTKIKEYLLNLEKL